MRVLLLLRGAPGCGKSTWIDRNGLSLYALSADEIRMMMASPSMQPDGSYAISQANDKAVWNILFEILENRMRSGEFTVIDATNSKTSEMNRYKKLCDEYRYRMYIVDMTDIPIEVVKERNSKRDPMKVVPENVIERMYSRFATQKIPAGITVLRPDELDRVSMKKIDISQYRKVHIIGDIHGCYTALKEYMDNYGTYSEEDFYIFLGDYIDRGIENAQVVQFLSEFVSNRNTLLLEGNHERWLWKWANDAVAPSKEFELHTRQELEAAGIDKKQTRVLYRRLGQCAWFTYHGKEYFVSHAGISMIPDEDRLFTIAAEQMIKGVGAYNDVEAVEQAWDRLMPSNCFQVHGHRNTKELPVKASERCFNLEGEVEFGGHLRAIQLLPDGTVDVIEIKNDVFRVPEPLVEQENASETNIADLILQMRANKKNIREIHYGNISSFNFTKAAFYDAAWDSMTTKARGLYLNIPKAKVVARAYDKFFNINERQELDLKHLQFSLNFPVRAYVKENGFMGIAAWNEEDDSLFVTTKSSPNGDYAKWLREDMERIFGAEKMEKIKEFSKDHNVSFVFECVDMERDPHVIQYPESCIVLLDLVYNEIPFRKMSFEEMCQAADSIGIRHKEHAYTLYSWNEFFDWQNAIMEEDYLYNGRHIEGFVLEDSTGYMLKRKLNYYNFWKFMRSIAHETLRKGYIDPKRTSALATPLANRFYGWVKTQYDPEKTDIQKDICTLRSMFAASEAGKPFASIL